MDVVFNCSSCEQELAVDETATGEPIQCPSCQTTVIVPPRDQNRLVESKPMASVPAVAPPPPPAATPPEPAHRQLSVPQHQGPAEKLVKKSDHAEPAAAAAGPKVKHLRTKCIKRGQCVEVGHDRFDEVVADFIQKVGDDNVVSINTLSYGAMDTTGHMLPDYGVMIVYRG